MIPRGGGDNKLSLGHVDFDMPVSSPSQICVDSGNNPNSSIHLTNIYSVLNLTMLWVRPWSCKDHMAQHHFQAKACSQGPDTHLVIFIFETFSGILFHPSKFPLTSISSYQSPMTESVARMTFPPLKATDGWPPLCGRELCANSGFLRHGGEVREDLEILLFLPIFSSCQAQCQRRERQCACTSGALGLGRGGSHSCDTGKE